MFQVCSQNSGGSVAHFGGTFRVFLCDTISKRNDIGEFIDRITAYFSRNAAPLKTVHKKKKKTSFAGKKKEEFERLRIKNKLTLF